MDRSPAYRKGWLAGRFDPRSAADDCVQIPYRKRNEEHLRLEWWQGHAAGRQVRLMLIVEVKQEWLHQRSSGSTQPRDRI